MNAQVAAQAVLVALKKGDVVVKRPRTYVSMALIEDCHFCEQCVSVATHQTTDMGKLLRQSGQPDYLSALACSVGSVIGRTLRVGGECKTCGKKHMLSEPCFATTITLFVHRITPSSRKPILQSVGCATAAEFVANYVRLRKDVNVGSIAEFVDVEPSMPLFIDRWVPFPKEAAQ